MERDYVGIVELDAADCAAAPGIAPIPLPHTACQWLNRIDCPCPPEDLGEQACDPVQLVLALHLPVFACGVIGFIPQVPTQNAVVVAELAQHSSDVFVKRAGVAAVVNVFGPGALHPPGIVYAGSGRALPTQPGERVPAGIEQHKKRLDPMARRDADELRQAGLESLAVLGPQLIVQEYPHRVESMKAGHAQLVIDASRVVGAGLKHFELIDGRRGGVVDAHQPALRLVPVVGAFGCPAPCLGGGPRRPAQPRAHCQGER